MNRQFRLIATLFLGPFLLVSCSKLSPEQEHFAQAYSAYNKGEFTSAVLYLKPLIEAGNPAAQLLMSKMYANGDGVPVDIGKSEMLKNLAAFQIFKKHNIAPGERDPMSGSLASISNRLDYYVGVGEGKEAPVKDLNQILQSLDVRTIKDLQSPITDPGDSSPESLPAEPPASSNGVSVNLPSEISKAAAQMPSETDPSPATSEAPQNSPTPEPVAKDGSDSSRASNQISLSIIRQAAENGDATAMGLLSSAYAHGFYGLAISTAQAGVWAQQAVHARSRTSSREDHPAQRFPVAQVSLILGIGLSLIGSGVWFLWRNTSR